MSGEDISYFRRRAIAERSRMALAPNAKIAALHQRLAELYEDLIAASPQGRTGQDLEPLLRNSQQERLDRL
jgi:hypothetical protein